MTLIDAGPLIALIDKAQAEVHRQCVLAVDSLPGSLITTLPCFTEAMYFLGELNGWRGQEALWRFVEDDELILHIPTDKEWERQRELMEQYRDTPMDYADASLVSLAEVRGIHQILTLDSGFYVYRINHTETFEVIRP